LGLAGSPVIVAAYLSEVGVASEALDEVLNVGHLVQLVEHMDFEVPFGIVLYGLPGPSEVEVGLEGEMDRS
jgi:hypothetical protein